MAFKFNSASFDCNAGIITLNYTGDDTGVTIFCSANNPLPKSYNTSRISAGKYQVLNWIPENNYMLLLIEDLAGNRYYHTLINNCDCQTIPEKLSTTFNTYAVNSSNGILFVDYYTTPNIEHYYNLYINVNYYVKECSNPFVISAGGILIENWDFLFGMAKDSCDFSYDLVLQDPSNGCVLYYIPKTKCVLDLNFKLSYSSLRGLQYSWDKLQGANIKSEPPLPPKGTKLPDGEYCYKIYDDSTPVRYRCECKCVTVKSGLKPSSTPCPLTLGKEVEIITDKSDCSVLVNNKSSISIDVDLRQSTVYTDGCLSPFDSISLQKFTIPPYKAKLFYVQDTTKDIKVVITYNKGLCTLEQCIPYCGKHLDDDVTQIRMPIVKKHIVGDYTYLSVYNPIGNGVSSVTLTYQDNVEGMILRGGETKAVSVDQGSLKFGIEIQNSVDTINRHITITKDEEMPSGIPLITKTDQGILISKSL